MNPAYGIMAEFDSAEAMLAAKERAFHAGYTHLETYAPYPVEGAMILPGRKRSPVAPAMLIGGLLSGAGAFFMEWYAARDYPIDVGGRPLNSWPAFIPITFELTVLGAALTGVVTFFIATRLPRLDHPVFNDGRFYRASQDRFFLCILAADPLYPDIDRDHLRGELGAGSVEEVPQ